MSTHPQNPPKLNKLLTPKQTAEILDTTEGSLSVWRCTGRIDLPFIKIGKNVRYRPEDVQDFLSRNTFNHT